MNFRAHALITFFLCLACFGVYGFTAARTVTWAHLAQSSPQLLTQIHLQPLTWNSHLPYLATAKIFRGLTAPLNLDPAFPFNLLSAFWASLTVGVVYLIILSLAPALKKPPHLTKPPNLIWLPSAFGSLALAFSLTFWSQALVAQTITFNFFLFSLLGLFLLKISRSAKKKSPGLIFWSLFLLLILVVNNLSSIKVPIRLRTFQQILTNLETISLLIIANFKTPSLVLAVIGLAFGLEKRKPRFLLPGFLVGQVFFDSLFLTATTPAFFLPSLLIIAIFCGLGFKLLLEIVLAVSLSNLALSFENQLFLLIFKIKKAGQIFKYLSLSFLIYLVVTALLVNFQTTYPLVDLKNENRASSFGQQAIAVLPQRAIVFCEEEKFLFTLDYFSRVINPRHQLELYLFDQTTETAVKTNLNRRPIFFALVESPISPGKTTGKWEGYTLVSKGPLYQVQKPQALQ